MGEMSDDRLTSGADSGTPEPDGIVTDRRTVGCRLTDGMLSGNLTATGTGSGGMPKMRKSGIAHCVGATILRDSSVPCLCTDL